MQSNEFRKRTNRKICIFVAFRLYLHVETPLSNDFMAQQRAHLRRLVQRNPPQVQERREVILMKIPRRARWSRRRVKPTFKVIITVSCIYQALLSILYNCLVSALNLRECARVQNIGKTKYNALLQPALKLCTDLDRQIDHDELD